MKATLDAISGTGITATIVGNCLHLARSTPFSVTTPENQLMNIIANEANTVAELPASCRHNYVVKIVNSGDIDDDFYLKFKCDKDKILALINDKKNIIDYRTNFVRDENDDNIIFNTNITYF